jgi:hypothetical protein
MIHGKEGQLILEMNIGNQGNMDSGTDPMDGDRCRLIRNGDTNDFTTRFLQRVNLLDRGSDVAGIAGGHGLDHNRCIAADPDTSEINGFRLSSSDVRTQ